MLSGALAAPAVFLAATAIRSGPTPAAALAGLAVAVSPTLVARSREVSGIPLYGLLLIAAAAALALAARKPTAANLAAVALSHAAALFTYYLAPFVVVANGAILWWRKAGKPAVLAFGAGVILGSPALVLAVATFFRDHGARETARTFPALAWGQHEPLEMASDMIRIAFDAFGRSSVPRSRCPPRSPWRAVISQDCSRPGVSWRRSPRSRCCRPSLGSRATTSHRPCHSPPCCRPWYSRARRGCGARS